ncbi:MAG: RnfABCDGE type electron transport complex subunit B [Betaproteobacteria bacterium]|nr:RnfABCDGE type electron transport complex subunit B [Betaproteobacteria bacterium]
MRRDSAARIDEARCIGCTLCIEACPVDAIIGARGVMHAVMESWCIGCALCVPPCPVDCIVMEKPAGRFTDEHKKAAQRRARARKARLARQAIRPVPDPAAALAEALARRKRK